MSPITRTFLRSPETMERYMQEMQARKDNSTEQASLWNWEKDSVHVFDHWAIISNEFPYDAVALTSHMLIPKRDVPFDWRLLSTEERKELEVLRYGYLAETYDVLWENLPKGQTVPGHFHLHLLILKRETT